MNTRNAGVTLIELIIIIIILGVLFSLILPRMGDSGRRDVRAALITLQSDLRYVRKLAMSEGVYARIWVTNKNTGSYRIQKRYSMAGQLSTIRNEQLKNIKFTTVNTPDNAVEYTPRGTTGSACTITVKSGNYEGSLTVNVGAGRIEIKNIVKK